MADIFDAGTIRFNNIDYRITTMAATATLVETIAMNHFIGYKIISVSQSVLYFRNCDTSTRPLYLHSDSSLKLTLIPPLTERVG